MAKSVFTGWRTVTPGKCYSCGETDGWTDDGAGHVYCECQVCSECDAAPDCHTDDCPTLCPVLQQVATPRCDMDSTCTHPVSHIDCKGYVYCATHGAQRGASGVRTRKLTPAELATVLAGKPIERY